jgi:superfamily I DNA and/or RNA helicase
LNQLQQYQAWIMATIPKKQIEMMLLNEARVIFCTLCISGRSQMLRMDDVDVLVVDEAGQSVEAETLISLSA